MEGVTMNEIPDSLKLLIEEAKWVVLMFDQLNTNQTVERIGSRGILLKESVEDLRKTFLSLGIDPYRTEKEGTWREGYTNA
jgi:hypothetical protein